MTFRTNRLTMSRDMQASTWDIFAHQEKRLLLSQVVPQAQPEISPAQRRSEAEAAPTEKCGVDRPAAPEFSHA